MERFTRNELYDRVWEQPVTKLSKVFNVSEKDIRKACRSSNIPLPYNGYWSKKAHGKEVFREPLEGDLNEIVSMSTDIGKSDEEIRKKLLESKRIIEVRNTDGVYVNSKSKKRDLSKEVLAVKDSLMISERYEFRFPGIYTSDENLICTVSVSRVKIDRACTFLNEFIYSLKARGHDVYETSGQQLRILGKELRFKLREKSTTLSISKDSFGYDERKFMPSGKFELKFDSFWFDSYVDGRECLEDQIPLIIARLELSVEEWLKRRAEQAIADEKAKELKRLQNELEEKKSNELSMVKELYNEAQIWKKVQLLRKYVASMESDSRDAGFITWAKDKLDWLDPDILANDILLDSDDRNELIKELLGNKEKEVSTASCEVVEIDRTVPHWYNRS